jgi:hypothetical protein
MASARGREQILRGFALTVAEIAGTANTSPPTRLCRFGETAFDWLA